MARSESAIIYIYNCLYVKRVSSFTKLNDPRPAAIQTTVYDDSRQPASKHYNCSRVAIARCCDSKRDTIVESLYYLIIRLDR